MLTTQKRRLSFDQFIEALEQNDQSLPEHIQFVAFPHQKPNCFIEPSFIAFPHQMPNCLDEQQIKRLFTALRNNSTLKTLIIDKSLADTLSGGDYKAVHGDTAQVLAEALAANKTLTSLALRFTNIGEDEAPAFADALKVNSSLTELDLTGNPLGDHKQALAEALRFNSSLIKLVLTINDASAFLNPLQENTTLTELILNGPDEYNSRPHPNNLFQLIELLKHNTTLTKLWTDKNHQQFYRPTEKPPTALISPKDVTEDYFNENYFKIIEECMNQLYPYLQRNRRIVEQRDKRISAGFPRSLAWLITNTADRADTTYSGMLYLIAMIVFKKTGSEHLQSLSLDCWAKIFNFNMPKGIAPLDAPQLNDWDHKMAQLYIGAQLSVYIEKGEGHILRAEGLLAAVYRTTNTKELIALFQERQNSLENNKDNTIVDRAVDQLLMFCGIKHKDETAPLTPFTPGDRYLGIVGFWSRAPRVEAAPVPPAAGAVPNPQPTTTGQEESPGVVEAPTPQEKPTEDVKTPRKTPQMAHR